MDRQTLLEIEQCRRGLYHHFLLLLMNSLGYETAYDLVDGDYREVRAVAVCFSGRSPCPYNVYLQSTLSWFFETEHHRAAEGFLTFQPANTYGNRLVSKVHGKNYKPL